MKFEGSAEDFICVNQGFYSMASQILGLAHFFFNKPECIIGYLLSSGELTHFLVECQVKKINPGLLHRYFSPSLHLAQLIESTGKVWDIY